MSDKVRILDDNQIQSRIYTLRGLQVMLDRDLAELYGVETRALNQAVKRNIERFPPEFMFQLINEELENLISPIVISNKETLTSQFVISRENRGGHRKLPYAFTEQGVSMLSAVLKGKIAIEISIKIINSFVQMRKFISQNAILFLRLNRVEQKQLATDTKLDKVFEALEAKEIKPKQGIFIGASLKDLGKKWFAFSKFDRGALDILERLEK